MLFWKHQPERVIETESLDYEQLEATAHAQQKIEHDLSRWEAIKTYPKASLWLLYMVWMMILVGYENNAGGIVLSIPQFRKDFGYEYQGEYVLYANWQSAISGAPQASLVVGSFCASWVADRIGRKWVLVFSLVLTMPSIALEFVATSINVFLAGKIINAFSLGIINTLAMAYVSEVSPLALRGIVAGACSVALCIGPFVCLLINNTTVNFPTRMAYRGLFIAEWAFSATSLIVSPFIPESPYYYIRVGKDEQAMKTLKRLFNPTQAQQQYAIMKTTYEELRMITESSTYADCFRKKDLKRTLLVMFSFFMQSMSGITFVIGYATYYFELAGFSTSVSYHMSLGMSALAIAANIVSWFLIDRLGRRPLMIWGMVSLTVLNLIVACTGMETSNRRAMTCAAAFMIMYGFFYNLACGPLPYILSTEVSSVSLRAKTMALASITNYAFQCMWSFTLPYMFNPDQANMGSKINFIFTGMSFLSIFAYYFYQPETAGRSFEEIDEMYAENVPPRKWKTYRTEKQQVSDKMFEAMKTEVSHAEYADEE